MPLVGLEERHKSPAEERRRIAVLRKAMYQKLALALLRPFWKRDWHVVNGERAKER